MMSDFEMIMIVLTIFLIVFAAHKKNNRKALQLVRLIHNNVEAQPYIGQAHFHDTSNKRFVKHLDKQMTH